jgi:tRNA nucleotidyltransferase (CCA-adding enzyme)
MADYIYLLQTRLTQSQQSALEHVREAARSRSMTVFLVGGAVRDMTTGSPIRDLDFAVQGNATKLKKDLQKAGGTLIGEDEPTQALYFNFPGGVRLEVGSTLSATYPKPGKPVYKPATILDDLRRRDFTANAMAISLNDGSYGLLMDPLNGVADLENRELRLVSNYGFIEDPARMIRAARFSARLGWQLEEKTQQRYETGKSEGYISALSPALRKYELEEIFHEEDPLRVLRRLESEGWAKVLSPAWTSAKANEVELNRLRDTVGQMESMGIYPDPSAAYFPLLTAKLAPKEVTALKNTFARPGFVDQIGALDAETKAFATLFSSKAAAAPSDAWKLLFSSPPEPILWLANTTKSAPLQARFKAFFSDWSQARNKIPYQLMQEMRILPSVPGYDALLETLFFAVMDGKLDTPEDAKAFLEPFSPPAPPPPVNLRRRAVKRETKPAKPRSKKPAAETKADAVEPEVTPAPLPSSAPAPKAPVKVAAAKPAAPLASKPTPKAPPEAAKKAVPAKSAPKKVVPPKKAAKPAPKAVVKKAIPKPVAKKAVKVVPKKAVVKKAAAKKVVSKKSAKKTVVPKKKPAAKAKPVGKPAAKKTSKPVAKKAAKPVLRSKAKPKPSAKAAAKPKSRR